MNRTLCSNQLRTFCGGLEVFLGYDLLGAAVLGVHQARGGPTAAAVAADEGTEAEERTAGEEHAMIGIDEK